MYLKNIIKSILQLVLILNIIPFCLYSSFITDGIISQKEVQLLNNQSAQITLDKNSAILYHKRKFLSPAFYTIINNKPSCFIIYKTNAAQEQIKTFKFNLFLDTDMEKLYAYQVSHKYSNMSCISYAIFNPHNLFADNAEKQNESIYIFHFIKRTQSNNGFIIFGENPIINNKEISEKLIKICKTNADILAIKPLSNKSIPFQTEEVFDDGITIYDDEDDSSTNSEIIDESDLADL